MASAAGLLGLAIVLALAAGFGLSWYERSALRRGWRIRGFARPGAVSSIIGATAAVLVTGRVSGNVFVLAAAGVAAASGHSLLLRGGRARSFLILWLSAVIVVATLNANIPLTGERTIDVALTALLLACFCGLLRELDIRGPSGWLLALLAAVGTAGLSFRLDLPESATLMTLVAGAVFAIVAAVPLAAGMLGRMGSRFVGLVVGAAAIRIAVVSPMVMVGVFGAACLVAVGYVATLESPIRGRVTAGLVGVAALLAAVSVPAVKTLLDVYRPMTRTVASSRALVSAEPVSIADTSARLAQIYKALQSYATRLEKPQTRAGSFVPLLGANVRAATLSARAAADLAQSADQLLASVNVRAVSLRDGAVSRDALEQLLVRLEDVESTVRKSQSQVAPLGETNLLVPKLRSGVLDLQRQLHDVRRRVGITLRGTQAANQLLGFDRPRRYFVAVQNNAESRATGGYIANYAVLVFDKGKLVSRDVGRTLDFDLATNHPRTLHAPLDFSRRYSSFDVNRNWTNINLSPDFPTVAAVIADQYRQYSGDRVDGVVAIDPIGLAGLLRLTGPVRVEGWPVPLTPDNTVAVTLHDEYRAFENDKDARVDFLGRFSNEVLDQLTGHGLSDLVKAGPVVHDLTSNRRLQFWSPDKRAAAFFRETQSDGRVPPAASDTVMVTTQNAAGNKADFFLRRSLKYEAAIRKAGSGLRVDATLRVTLRNDAPAVGEPRYVIGPYDNRFAPGQNRLFFTAYSPFQLQSATIDGAPLLLEAQPELGRTAYSAFVDIPSHATRTIELHLSGTAPNTRRYVLDLVHQPVVATEEPFELVLHGVGQRGLVTSNTPLKRNERVDIRLR